MSVRDQTTNLPPYKKVKYLIVIYLLDLKDASVNSFALLQLKKIDNNCGYC